MAWRPPSMTPEAWREARERLAIMIKGCTRRLRELEIVAVEKKINEVHKQLTELENSSTSEE